MRKAILVVEDNWQDRALLSLMLERAGFSVIHALNGAEASCVLRRHRSKITIVVMGDNRLDPDRSFAECIRQTNPRLPVFFKSAVPWTSAQGLSHTIEHLKPLALMIRINRALEENSQPVRSNSGEGSAFQPG